MGVLAPESADARPSTRAPHIRNPRTTFENTPLFPPKCSIVHGGGGVPMFFYGLEYSYFCYLRPHAKFRNPRTTFENTPLFPLKYSIVQGLEGFPNFLIFFNPNIFVS